MTDSRHAPLDPGSPASAAQSEAKRETRSFVAGSWLLVICVLICGVFAGLAGEEVGDKDTMFALAFIFLGFVTVGIFALAWVDASTRQERHDWEYPH